MAQQLPTAEHLLKFWNGMIKDAWPWKACGICCDHEADACEGTTTDCGKRGGCVCDACLWDPNCACYQGNKVELQWAQQARNALIQARDQCLNEMMADGDSRLEDEAEDSAYDGAESEEKSEGGAEDESSNEGEVESENSSYIEFDEDSDNNANERWNARIDGTAAQNREYAVYGHPQVLLPPVDPNRISHGSAPEHEVELPFGSGPVIAIRHDIDAEGDVVMGDAPQSQLFFPQDPREPFAVNIAYFITENDKQEEKLTVPLDDEDFRKTNYWQTVMDWIRKRPLVECGVCFSELRIAQLTEDKGSMPSGSPEECLKELPWLLRCGHVVGKECFTKWARGVMQKARREVDADPDAMVIDHGNLVLCPICKRSVAAHGIPEEA